MGSRGASHCVGSIRSVASLTRNDGVEFLALAPRVPIETHVTPFALAEASQALTALRDGAVEGALALEIRR
jgi:alcohol dehydrogenase, propanol-preferring